MSLRQLMYIIILLLIAFYNALGNENLNQNEAASHTEIKSSSVGFSMEYTEVMAKPAGIFSLDYSFPVGTHWNLGIVGSGLYYNHTLSSSDLEGTFQMEGGYAGLFLEYNTKCSDDILLTFRYTTASGIVKYELDKKYRAGKLWYEKTVDRDEFVVNMLAGEISYKLFSQWWIGFTLSFKLTSPIELHQTDEFLLNTITGGLTLRYQIK